MLTIKFVCNDIFEIREKLYKKDETNSPYRARKRWQQISNRYGYKIKRKPLT